MLKKITLAVAVALTPRATIAAEIGAEPTLVCRSVNAFERAREAGRQGDKEGVLAILTAQIRSGHCSTLAPGLKVRIEATKGPYVCIAPFGSADECQWTFPKELRQ